MLTNALKRSNHLYFTNAHSSTLTIYHKNHGVCEKGKYFCINSSNSRFTAYNIKVFHIFYFHEIFMKYLCNMLLRFISAKKKFIHFFVCLIGSTYILLYSTIIFLFLRYLVFKIIRAYSGRRPFLLLFTLYDKIWKDYAAKNAKIYPKIRKSASHNVRCWK